MADRKAALLVGGSASYKDRVAATELFYRPFIVMPGPETALYTFVEGNLLRCLLRLKGGLIGEFILVLHSVPPGEVN